MIYLIIITGLNFIGLLLITLHASKLREDVDLLLEASVLITELIKKDD